MKIVREPLLHFLIAGACLFLLFAWLADDESAEVPVSREIIVTPGRIEHLTSTFAKVWQRPPTEDEMAGLIYDYIREEVYYREAMAMGLDRDDTIVRRRMKQKLEFLSEDILATVEPTTDELQAYLDENVDAYRVESKLTFQQVYFNLDERGNAAVTDAQQLLVDLRKREDSVDVTQLGDRSMLEQRMDALPEREIERHFGREFRTGLLEAPVGEWHGPIRSGYGLHLVHISEVVPVRKPMLDEVREAVTRDWEAEKRRESNEAFYQKLLDRYIVTIEDPNEGTVEAATRMEVNP